MKRNKKQPLEVPPIETLEKELHRELYKKSYRSTLRSTVYTLITVAAVAVLVATLVLPVLQIYGTSMTPTLSDGDIVVSVSGSEFEAQDIIAFYYNNKILVYEKYESKAIFARPVIDNMSAGNIMRTDYSSQCRRAGCFIGDYIGG